MCHQVSTEPAGGASDATADAALVAATLAGDRDAFGLLVTRYQDRLFNTLVRIGASREDAADVVQEAFVQAYTKLASFQGASQFYTWLYRVAMNISISRRRRKRPTASLDAAREATGDEPADRAAGPEGTAVSHERVAIVRTALAHLGEEQRRILVLREIDGASYEEIAEILELPIGTVRSRLFRARMQLREKLEGVEESGIRSQESKLPAHG